MEAGLILARSKEPVFSLVFFDCSRDGNTKGFSLLQEEGIRFLSCFLIAQVISESRHLSSAVWVMLLLSPLGLLHHSFSRVYLFPLPFSICV